MTKEDAERLCKFAEVNIGAMEWAPYNLFVYLLTKLRAEAEECDVIFLSESASANKGYKGNSIRICSNKDNWIVTGTDFFETVLAYLNSKGERA